MNSKTNITQFLSNVEDCLLINGYFDDSLTAPIISYVTKSQIDNKKSGNKLSFLVAESFQNIIRHGYDECEVNKRVKLKKGYFALLKRSSEITICSSNAIESEKVEQLESKIKRLSNMDKVSLKTEFIDVLINNKTTDGGGAGLGLIEMIRKSGPDFEYWFSKKEEDISFVHFDIFFNENKLASVRKHKLDTTELRNICSDDNILFLRKGLFNHDTFLQMSAVLESKANRESELHHKTLFYIFVELIQNIYKHGFSNEEGDSPGLFYVQEFEDHLCFNSQNLSSIENATNTIKRIDDLNKLSSKELLLLYKQRLTNQIDFTKNKSANLGLIEILKESKNPLVCTITEQSSYSCNLNISVKLST
jgi:hypothetical protein